MVSGEHTHTEVIDEAVAPTCTETGLTAGSHCSVCTAVIVAQETIEATGHNYSEEITNAATCTEDGLKTFTCANCSDTYTEVIDALGHRDEDSDNACDGCGTAMLVCNHTTNEEGMNLVAAVAPDCTTAGTIAHYTCDYCDDVYAYVDDAWTKITDESDLVVTALGHDYSSLQNNEDGTHSRVCSRDGCGNVEDVSTEHTYTDGTCACGAIKPSAPASEAIAIAGTTGTLSSDSSSISWTGTSATVTNKKGSTAIRTSDSDHYRIYSGSTVTISSEYSIKTVVITATSGSYASVINDSLTNSGHTVTVSGSTITIELAEPATSITFTASAQTRINNVVVNF